MAEPSPTSILPIIRVLKRFSPVVIGLIIYFVLSRFVGLEVWLSGVIAFGIAIFEWFAFSIVEKTMMKIRNE